jgi:hypothetical protein
MSDPQSILDKVMVLMDQHLDQIKFQSTILTKDGLKGLSPTDAAVVERYAKVLLTVTKQAGSDPDETSTLTDAELEEQARAILEGQAHAASTSDTN